MRLFFCLAFSLISFYSTAQIPEKAIHISPLLIGEKIPNVKLKTEKNEDVSITAFTELQPTILVFYRGNWCPYCTKHLSAIAEIENEIKALGYHTIAIAPFDLNQLGISNTEKPLNYTLLADVNSNFIQQMGIGFLADEKTITYMSTKNGKATEVLPVPSIFVLNTEGEILFEYIAPNYKERMSSELLLAVLKNLKSK